VRTYTKIQRPHFENCMSICRPIMLLTASPLTASVVSCLISLALMCIHFKYLPRQRPSTAQGLRAVIRSSSQHRSIAGRCTEARTCRAVVGCTMVEDNDTCENGFVTLSYMQKKSVTVLTLLSHEPASSMLLWLVGDPFTVRHDMLSVGGSGN
jgi:hypothetical protein